MLQVGIEPTTFACRYIVYTICIRATLYQLSYWSGATGASVLKGADASPGNRTQDLLFPLRCR
jgi:hypothetical protein